MEQLTKNQAVATSQEAVQNQNEPQLRDENAHNDKSVHGVLNPTYQAGLRRDAVQPDIEAEQIGRAVQQECRDRYRMPSSACKKKNDKDSVPGEPSETRSLDRRASPSDDHTSCGSYSRHHKHDCPT